MNAISFGTAARKRLGTPANEPRPDASSVDMAWLVLEAANDLGDDAAVAACRRVIDATLNGAPAPQSDVLLIVEALSEPLVDARWRYGIVGMTGDAVEVVHKDRTVWSKPYTDGPGDHRSWMWYVSAQ